MDSKSLITVAIPGYNRRHLLGEALESVRRQTLQEYKVLISDNSSTDGTKEFLESIRDPRVKVVTQRENIGGARNWRFVLTTPTTRYVALLEDDNLWEPDHLARAVAALEGEGRASFYSAKTTSFGLGETQTYGPFWLSEAGGCIFSAAEDLGCKVVGRNLVAASSVVLRRASLDRIRVWGTPDLNMMDRLWWGQLALDGGFVYDSAPGARYRWHEHNWSSALAGPGRKALRETKETTKVLANLAYERGLLDRETLVREVARWPAADAAAVIVALSAEGAHPQLRAGARELLRRRRKEMRGAGVSRHAKLAAMTSPMWLLVADRFDRLLRN